MYSSKWLCFLELILKSNFHKRRKHYRFAPFFISSHYKKLFAMKKNLFFLAFSLLVFATVFAQKDVVLNINHVLGNKNFSFRTKAVNNLGDTFTYSRFDYYLSKFTIIHDGGQETAVDPNLYIFVKEATNVNQLLGNYNVTDVEGIKFHVGVDSPNNNSDPTLWVAPHPLAPQNPIMHWGWAAGYKFIAIDGACNSSQNALFELHALWNKNYFEQTVMARGFTTGNTIQLYVTADGEKAVENIDLSSGPLYHGDNSIDLVALTNFRDNVFSATITNSIDENSIENKIKVYPNPSNGSFILNIENTTSQINAAKIVSITGQVIKEIELNKNGETTRFTMDGSGIYFLQLIKNNQLLCTKKLVVY